MTFRLDSLGILILLRSNFLLSISALCLVSTVVASFEVPSVATVCSCCIGSLCLISALFLCASWFAHCLLSLCKSLSALFNSSFNSSTFLSCPAKATRNPLGSLGEGTMSVGVGGKDVAVDVAGVCLVESLLLELGAMGKLSDKGRAGRTRGVEDEVPV